MRPKWCDHHPWRCAGAIFTLVMAVFSLAQICHSNENACLPSLPHKRRTHRSSSPLSRSEIENRRFMRE
jgi:hypothetical protein